MKHGARILAALTFAVLGAALCACQNTKPEPEAPPSQADPVQAEEAPVEYPIEIAPGEETFSAAPLTDEIIETITGVSWKENEKVPLDALSLLTLSYVGFDGKRYTGQMIAAAEVGEELADIFRELYEAGFPIERMQLIDTYGADDNASMADNNTSAFCYREIAGTDVLSNHSFGKAVDINPVQNPYVRGDVVQPEDSRDYMNREDVRPGMITPGDVCYNAFTSRGWSWGGEWSGTGVTDYQHFEKETQPDHQ